MYALFRAASAFFIGIDISKKTLDFAVRDQNKHLFHLKVDNSMAGLNQFKQECLTKNVNLEQSLICCEHTGVYSQNILALATENDLSLWLESSLRIKRSLGLQRGKSDKIDAIRISEYVPAGNRFRYADKASLWQPERQTISKLRQLVSLRKRLLNAKNALKVPVNEVAAFQDKKLQKEMEKLNKKPIEALEKQIAEVEKKIKALIKEAAAALMIRSSTCLAWLLQWTVLEKWFSVRWSLLLMNSNSLVVLKSLPATQAWLLLIGPPKRHTSGTSIRGGTRVSHLANKQMKKLLHMAALSVVSGKGEMADYYHRKVKQAVPRRDKNKMLVLNAVRNKIIHRVFACIRDNRKYEKIYTTTLV